jgi:G3E family GTPase
LPLQEATPAALANQAMDAVLLFSSDEQALKPREAVNQSGVLFDLRLEGDEFTFVLHPQEPGLYALYTQHHPTEFQLALSDARGTEVPVVLSHNYKPKHEHDNEVTSVGIETPGDLDPEKLNKWLGKLLRTQGQDIFRMKGVLSIQGQEERYVFQGVHMLFDGRPDRPWGETPRRNSLIFIGRKLNREQLQEGFRTCLV